MKIEVEDVAVAFEGHNEFITAHASHVPVESIITLFREYFGMSNDALVVVSESLAHSIPDEDERQAFFSGIAVGLRVAEAVEQRDIRELSEGT